MSKELVNINLFNSTTTLKLPEDINECIELIDKGCKALEKTTTLTKWHIGYIIDHLLQSGGKGVYNTLEDSTGYKRRFLSHTVRFYRAFPDINIINQLCAKEVKWYILRELPTLPDAKKDEIINKILNEDLSTQDIITLTDDAYSSEELPTHEDKDDNVYEDSEDEDTPSTESYISDTSSGEYDDDDLELKKDSRDGEGRVKDNWEGDDETAALDPEKWFFKYNQTLVKLENDFAGNIDKVSDYLNLKDNIKDENKWEQVNKIVDRIITNTTKLTTVLDVFKGQCSTNLEKFSE